MEENGGNGEGGWENSGRSTWDVGCGGLWQDVVVENGRKMGEKWEKSGTKYAFFTVPFSEFFRRSKIFPTVPFVKTISPHSLTEKWEFLPLTDAPCHGGCSRCVALVHAVF